MNWRWVPLWALVVGLAVEATGTAAAGAAGEGGEARDDDVPDALDDDDTELALHREESRNVQPRAYTQQAAAAYNALPSGFRPSPAQTQASLAELAGYARQQQTQHQQQQHHRQGGENRGERPTTVQRQHTEQAERLRGERGEQREEDEEREEPDRLSVLLQQSRFDCGTKHTGYYADEELQCEVFHYCQDGVKHSWICPDGFTFHQVHLICMPPTHDNICQQSKKYHFVNDYLYRAVNTEEVERKPNTPLRYSERYYPAEVYHDERREFYDEDDEDQEEVSRPTARPTSAPAPPRPAAPAPSPAPAQVFRSAEEVNIPLVQRRPHPPHRPYEFRF